MARRALTEPVVRSASFSRDLRFRYRLTRTWDENSPRLVWVMLNPSAADSSRDDPTTRRVMAFSRAWGYGGCHVVNLFAYRTHLPSELAGTADPVGPGNGGAVAAVLREAAAAGTVVVGWGRADVARVGVAAAAGRMIERIERVGLRAMAVGVNADGSPRHPLYVPGTVRLTSWPSVTVGARHQP